MTLGTVGSWDSRQLAVKKRTKNLEKVFSNWKPLTATSSSSPAYCQPLTATSSSSPAYCQPPTATSPSSPAYCQPLTATSGIMREFQTTEESSLVITKLRRKP